MTTPDSARRWRIFAVCAAVAIFTILDLSKINVGLPSIEDSLGAGSTQLQLIVAGYTLAFGLALVPAGRLGDLYSRKTFFVIGLSAFTLTSIACALAPNIETLIVFRLLQGVAAGIQMPQVIGTIQQEFQGRERGQALGIFGATIGLATAFGPTLGGLLIAIGGEENGWRLLFWLNVPLGVITLLLALKLLPKRRGVEGRADLDIVGLALLGVAVLALMLPFLFTTGSGDDNPARWWVLVVFVVALAAFVGWERRYAHRGRSPAFDLSLFLRSSYRNGLLISSVYFAALPASFLLGTLYLQQGLGLSPLAAGAVTIAFALSSAVTAWWSGRKVNEWGRPLVVIGLTVVVIGFALTIAAAVIPSPELTPWIMAATLSLAGAGGGMVVSPNQTLALSEVPVRVGGVAGSMMQVGQRVGGAIGLALATSVFYATVYREEGLAEIVVYHDAYRNGVLVCVALMASALVVALVDTRRRSKRGQLTPVTDSDD